jgi:cytochrome c oxidase accessory protein FixG
MSKNKFELHDERLASTDEAGHRVYIHPENIKGKWRDRRTLFYSFLVILYLVLPWIHFKGKQIILLNIPAREFTFFGATFFAHDAPLFLLILLAFVFTMGLLTSVLGRVWCGWGCPQTVFIDLIYGRIEQLVEGKARARQKLQEMPWNLEKISKKSLKWFLFTIVTLHISHSFLGYFVGTRELFWITLSPPSEHMTLFSIMIFVTAVLLFDFGWFREQFCIIACPYGRLQSVMMDESSLVVAYDKKRGEPRRGTIEKQGEGDCINCYHCVKACPTGIDIRRGTQLECIACTNCIDACDDIMRKLKKPEGLIRYDSEANLEGKKVKTFDIRRIIYSIAIVIVLSLLGRSLLHIGDLKATLIRGGSKPYTERSLEGGVKEIGNLYRLRVDYKGSANKLVSLSVPKASNIKIVTSRNPFKLSGKKSKDVIVHFRFPQSTLTRGSASVVLTFSDQAGKKMLEKEVSLVGPLK